MVAIISTMIENFAITRNDHLYESIWITLLFGKFLYYGMKCLSKNYHTKGLQGFSAEI